MPAHYMQLILAVLFETIGTSALQASEQFTRPLPAVVVVIAYGLSFYLLSLTLAAMPVGLVYAIWSGLGIIFIAMIGFLVFGQNLDLPAVAGIGMILAGILVIHLFSEATPHG